MAHLLNHSCEPNCYSRLTDVWHEAAGRVEQHVILYAKRDIAALEELTYDYRCDPRLNTLALGRRLMREVCRKLSADCPKPALRVRSVTHQVLSQAPAWSHPSGMHGFQSMNFCLTRRFCSDQLLPCNCGASSCRGFVNAPELDSPRTAIVWAPSTEVQPWTGARAVA